jgi:predicted regulator of Ras-like GTPase activity (Roadblock/LC7/MglB family)
VTIPSGQGDDTWARGQAHARVRNAVRAIMDREESGLGLLLAGPGVVTAAAGTPGVVDPVTFATLASAHAQAAQALAPLVAGTEFSHLVQEGLRSRIVLTALDGDHLLALLTSHDTERGPCASHRGPDVTELDDALAHLRAQGGGMRGGRVGLSWAQAAETHIDRVFREGR